METAPVLLSGDDGVPLRVREELEAVGIPVVAVCSSTATLAARAAAAAGWRPRQDLSPQPGMAISVVGTRAACDALLR